MTKHPEDFHPNIAVRMGQLDHKIDLRLYITYNGWGRDMFYAAREAGYNQATVFYKGLFKELWIDTWEDYLEDLQLDMTYEVRFFGVAGHGPLEHAPPNTNKVNDTTMASPVSRESERSEGYMTAKRGYLSTGQARHPRTFPAVMSAALCVEVRQLG